MWRSLFWMPVGFEIVAFFAILTMLVVTMLQFWYYSETVSLISMKAQKVWDSMFRLSTCQFQLLMISGLPWRYDNILVSFLWKSSITLPILLASKPNLVPRCILIHARQSNYVVVFYGSFYQVCKKEEKEKKMKKMSNFLKACISGMAGMIYFRSGMCSLLICWHLHSEFGLVRTKDHGVTNRCKIILCSSC